MIYVDTIGHMITDGILDELHIFAKEIGLKREWFQDKGWYSHYDLTTKNKINQAVKNGAQLINPKQIIKILKEAEFNQDNIK